jgi:hypothetical protein
MPTRQLSCVTALFAIVCGAPSVAFADQFVAMDDTWEHTPDMPDSHYRVKPTAETPADWTSPVDYTDGTAWVYLEVQTKPTEQETKFQVCFEATPTYACTAQSPTYTTVGTYEWATDFSDFWSPPNGFVDWTQGVNKLACILKDTMNNKPSADNVGPDVAALYTPTLVRMVVTIVSPGATYVPPTPTGEGGGGAGAGGAPATGGGGAGGANEGGGGPVTMPAPPLGGGSASGGGGQGSAAADDDDGCSASRNGSFRSPDKSGASRVTVGSFLALAALGLALSRRRRGAYFAASVTDRIPASWRPVRKTRIRSRRLPHNSI